MNVGNECHNNTSGDRGRGRKGWSNTPKQIPDDIKIQEQPWQDQTAWNFPYFMKLTIDQVDFNLVLTLLMSPVITTCHSIEEKAIDNKHYYMAVSHKDWELPNSRIWLAEIDIDRGLDFPSKPASRPILL